MFETQLRYMGGLSDVDWLVEEGLRDINERELALVVSGSARRQDSVLMTSDHEAWHMVVCHAAPRVSDRRLDGVVRFDQRRLCAHRQSEQIDIRHPRKDPLSLTAMNVRSGNVEVETGLLLDERRHEVADPIAETQRRCRLPGVPPSPSGIITTMTPIAGSVNRPASNTPTCMPTMP